MNKLFVLSHGRQTAINISKNMQALFGDHIQVKPICVEDGLFDIDFSKALVLDTGKWTEDVDVSSLIPPNTKCIRARRVVDFKRLYELMDLPENTDILLVNDHQKTTDIAIKQLVGLGFNQVNFYPYYPGIKSYRKLSVAITPGEAHLVPDCVKKVIDIGTRQIDLTTIVEVASALNILEEVAPTLSATYVKDMFSLVKKYSQAAKDASEMKDSFQVLADHSSSGIIYVDDDHRIVLMNKAFYRLSGKLVEDIIGQPVQKLIPQFESLLSAPSQKHLLDVFGRPCIIYTKEVQLDNYQTGMIINIEDADAIQKMEHELRRKNRQNIHTAKYRFGDIHTQSKKMHDVINLAKGISKSDATVLIQGESGTGKELLAQAIHMASRRKGAPFVPVNFAALPESLIESELFGYEEGAFTGAKKGGHQGLFETAHGGTLFLDEIGDAPLSFQTRLLRVIQERQVRRVGGRIQIPIDVRIIAASNRDLKALVKKGTFRKDLYYRICVLPLEVPALRERSEDIRLLLKMHMEMIQMQRVDLSKYLKPRTLEYLEAYTWPGNIRQLANLAEYLSHVIEPGQPIDTEALPLIVREDPIQSDKDMVEALMSPHEKWLMKTMASQGSMGRRSLYESAKGQGLQMSEANLRTLLVNLHEKGLIEIQKGRRGSQLTDLGQAIVSHL